MLIGYAKGRLDTFTIEMQSKLVALQYRFMISADDMN